jgi:hypothetical protein
VTKWFVFGFFSSEIWFVFLPFGFFLEVLVCWTENNLATLVARWFIFKPKKSNLEGLAMEDVN